MSWKREAAAQEGLRGQSAVASGVIGEHLLKRVTFEQRHRSSEGGSERISGAEGFMQGLSWGVGGHQGGQREPGATRTERREEGTAWDRAGVSGPRCGGRPVPVHCARESSAPHKRFPSGSR